MEKETVLEIEFKELWDNNFAWRITKNKLQSENFKDYEIRTQITCHKDYTAINLNTDDNYILYSNIIIDEYDKNELEGIVGKINEKYGMRQKNI